MARRTLIWHLGLPQAARPVVPASLATHAEPLADAGVLVAATPQEAEAATRELLRPDPTGGDASRRRDDAGTWARVCARVWDHKGVAVLSTPDLAAAGKDEVRLALDPLRGVEVHLVLGVEPIATQVLGAWLDRLRHGATTGWEKYAERVLADPGRAGGTGAHRQAEEFWAGHDLPAVLARWGWTLHDERLHVVAGRDPGATWARVLELAGLSSTQLPVALPAPAGPAGAAVLRRVNQALAADPGPTTRAVSLASTSQVLERAPEVDPGPLVPVLPAAADAGARLLVEQWRSDLGASAYDVRGEVGDLLDPVDPVAGRPVSPTRRDQLTVAVDTLAEALAENTRLREQVATVTAERDRLDRKRRKLKRRLRALR